MAGRNCHHVRQNGAEPAAHTIRIISAGGCSLPRQHLDSALTNAGGKPAPRPEPTDDKYGTSGTEAVKAASTHLAANEPTPPRSTE